MRLRLGNREQLVQLMQRNDVDLAIMGRPPKELATRAEPFAMHPHVLVTAADHPLLTRQEPRAGAGAGARGIHRARAGLGHARGAGGVLAPSTASDMRITMEMSSNETIKQAVMAGMGVELAVAAHDRAGVEASG